MTRRISLALAIHNHQPVGNFGWVFAEIYDQAYLPMLEALERHPGRPTSRSTTRVPCWSGSAPSARLHRAPPDPRGREPGGGPRRRVLRPVLASLPQRDRVGQLTRMGDELESMFGRRPRGAWLAERVWEPDLPASLVDGGYAWTILDDAHFRAAAIPEEDLWGPYTTEDQGSLLTVFGTEQGLRYRIPFRGVDEVIDYLRDHATEDGGRVGMMGDDGEKFGAWPSTWEHCWGETRWVDRFFERPRGQRRLAVHRHARRPGWPASGRSAGSTSRPAPTPRWANGRCPPTRAWPSPSCCIAPRPRAGPRRAGCGARSGATSR